MTKEPDVKNYGQKYSCSHICNKLPALLYGSSTRRILGAKETLGTVVDS
jgi:hypothetical protein